MLIIGAGMTGCLAGLMFPEATIYEAQDKIPFNHNAVLRFRDDSVSKFTGIPFKKVTVRKGIYIKGEYVQPDINIANMYSNKVLGCTVDRSIWNLEAAERFVAPADFQLRLAAKVKSRIHLSQPIEYIPSDIVLTTIPLPATLPHTSIETNADFAYERIHTSRFRLPDTDVHQTVYFPDNETYIYRATVTGDSLILESTEAILPSDLDYILHAMNLKYPVETINQKTQQYGKIKNIDEVERHRILYQLTRDYNVYSAGRFAIWKNVLMDDVLQDLFKIKEFIETSEYNRHKRLY